MLRYHALALVHERKREEASVRHFLRLATRDPGSPWCLTFAAPALEVLGKSYVKFDPVRWPRRDFLKAVSFVLGICCKGVSRKLFAPTRDWSIIVIYYKEEPEALRHHRRRRWRLKKCGRDAGSGSPGSDWSWGRDGVQGVSDKYDYSQEEKVGGPWLSLRKNGHSMWDVPRAGDWRLCPFPPIAFSGNGRAKHPQRKDKEAETRPEILNTANVALDGAERSLTKKLGCRASAGGDWIPAVKSASVQEGGQKKGRRGDRRGETT